MSSEAYLELFKIYDSAFFCKNSLPSLTYVSLRKKWPYSELFWSAFFPYFPAFGLNTERYGVSLRIQSECKKMREKCGPE